MLHYACVIFVYVVSYVMPNAIDITGKKLHLLTALYKVGKNKYGGWDWMFLCDCGKKKVYSVSEFSRTKSCGCLTLINQILAQGRDPHGLTNTKEHGIWLGMVSRCSNTSYAKKIYKLKKIKVCERWAKSFLNFLHDMGHCPDGYSIDRIDNNGNYEPANCRWADNKTQSNNRDVTIYIEYEGEKVPLAELCRRLGINRITTWKRLKKGLPIEDVIKEIKAPQTITVNGITKKIADWGNILGYTRAYSYRLNRQGKLLTKIQHLL